MKKKLATLAITGATVLSGSALASRSVTKDIHCEGVATKWVNDCQANGHDCASKAIKNFDGKEWLKMGAADCAAVKSALKSKSVRDYIERIQKGTVVATKRGKKF